MKLITFSLLVFIFFLLCKYLIYKEHFFTPNKVISPSFFINNYEKTYNTINIDLFHSIFNQYNLNITPIKTIKDVLIDKCYIKYIGNFLLYDEKPWLRSLTYTSILKNINSISRLFNIDVLIENSTNIIDLQNTYITKFVKMAYTYSKNNNPLFYYYNNIVSKQTFYSVDIIINYVINILNKKNSDELKWIEMMHSIFINNNILYFMDTSLSNNSNKYNIILLFGEYLLKELITYSKTIFVDIKNDITIQSDLITIKNHIFYNDDGDYFTNNLIFDCNI